MLAVPFPARRYICRSCARTLERSDSCWPGRVQRRRALQTSSTSGRNDVPDFAFAFDIDGVLSRGGKALPRASRTLKYLQSNRIPFILLTNGGGYSEKRRAERLSTELEVPLDPSIIVQSHTPFVEMDQYKEKTILVVGGIADKCRKVALQYGFKNVIIPGDILAQYPSFWPFSKVFMKYHAEDSKAQPLPRPIDPSNSTESLKIDAIFVYNDPRDWALDTTAILDCLLSKDGVLGTLSPKNNDPSLPNRGYQQDGQPPLYFSNPDLWFASDFILPRLGQGGFRNALKGVWAAATDNANLEHRIIGKPTHDTFLFAEKALKRSREHLHPKSLDKELHKVYMIGDNPESDIRGANDYESPFGSKWSSVLVQTGVFSGGKPSAEPTTIVKDVYDAVHWGMSEAGWRTPA